MTRWRPGTRPWFATKRPLAENLTDRATAPQGGIIASASDLARYMQMMMNGQDDVLSAAGKAQMMRPASAASPSYGFGWYRGLGQRDCVALRGEPRVSKSLAWMLPAQKKGAVVLVNGDRWNRLRGNDRAPHRHRRQRRWVSTTTARGRACPRRRLFIGLVLLPIVYLLSMVWAWRHRAAIRAKSGIVGRFSLWFPLLTTLVAAWVILVWCHASSAHRSPTSTCSSPTSSWCSSRPQ